MAMSRLMPAPSQVTTKGTSGGADSPMKGQPKGAAGKPQGKAKDPAGPAKHAEVKQAQHGSPTNGLRGAIDHLAKDRHVEAPRAGLPMPKGGKGPAHG